MESYFEFNITCNEDVREQLIAELAEEAYEGFIETENGFSAYVPGSAFKREVFEQLLQKYEINPDVVPQRIIEQQNWNAQWEAGYEPIVISNEVVIKAPFHKLDKSYAYELVIQPKNTFGTGHHETTQLMIRLMFQQQFENKRVFDYGCGTGVLAIMAAKLKAKEIYAIDIDEWCTDNVPENMRLNHIENIVFEIGTLDVVKTQHFDIILANINKNILLASFEKLSTLLFTNGTLLISGFYEADLSDLKTAAALHGLFLHQHISLNDWCGAEFRLQQA
jgi:ribosomal protein L11 methyltransferase